MSFAWVEPRRVRVSEWAALGSVMMRVADMMVCFRWVLGVCSGQHGV